MKRVLAFSLIAALTAFFAHGLTLRMVPKAIMNKVMASMQDRGTPVHDFVLSQRNTPQTQTVVRPSPDLAYSICLFDLSKTDTVDIRAGAWDKVASISFFDNRTNNFATIRLHAVDTTHVILQRSGNEQLKEQFGQVVTSPTDRGVILIRRVAPTDADYQRIEALSSIDQCSV